MNILLIKINGKFNLSLFNRKTIKMYFLRFFVVFIFTGVILEKVSKDYDWVLNFLRYADPEQLDNVPEGNN